MGPGGEEEKEEVEERGRKRCRKPGHLTPAPHSAPILLLFTPPPRDACHAIGNV